MSARFAAGICNPIVFKLIHYDDSHIDDQIRENDYPAIVRDFTDNILLVGITYDEDTKKRSCTIEYFS